MQRKAGADGILLHTTFAPHFRFGEIEYSRTDSSGKKVLNKEQYENEIRISKEVKRRQALSLADIEGRIIDEAGNIDPKKLKEFFNELQAQGVQIMTGKNAEALLKKHNANALYLPGDTPGQPGMIVLREGADKQHIIEEIFHLKQHEQEGFRTLGASEIIDMELAAHDQMLEYARTKGWTKEEIEQLERNKAAWESDKKKYNSDAEFRKKFDAELGGFKNRDDVFPDDKLNYYKRDDGEYLDVTLDDGSVVTLKRGAADQEWEIQESGKEINVSKEEILNRLPDNIPMNKFYHGYLPLNIDIDLPVEFGGALKKHPDRDLYILGRLKDMRIDKNTKYAGTKKVQDSLTKNNITGVHTLTNRPIPENWSDLPLLEQNEKYLKEINLPWLDEAISSGADIRFINDPRIESNQWVEPPIKYRNQYKRIRTFVYWEYKYLKMKGYTLLENGLMVKSNI